MVKRLEFSLSTGARSNSWTKTKHFQTRNFALLSWLPPEESGRIAVASSSDFIQKQATRLPVVESGYGRDLVEQLRALTRRDLCSLHQVTYGKSRARSSEPRWAWDEASV